MVVGRSRLVMRAGCCVGGAGNLVRSRYSTLNAGAPWIGCRNALEIGHITGFWTYAAGLEPGIHDVTRRIGALRKFSFAAPSHGLHHSSGMPELCKFKLPKVGYT